MWGGEDQLISDESVFIGRLLLFVCCIVQEGKVTKSKQKQANSLGKEYTINYSGPKQWQHAAQMTPTNL